MHVLFIVSVHSLLYSECIIVEYEMRLHFKHVDEPNSLYDIVPQIVTRTGRKKSIRIVVDMLYVDSAIMLSDNTYYPTTPCIPELIDVVNTAIEEDALGQINDDYSVSCVLLHANMGGAHDIFDWSNSEKNYTISMKEVHGRLINLEIAGLVYDSARNKILILLSLIRRKSDQYSYNLRSRWKNSTLKV